MMISLKYFLYKLQILLERERERKREREGGEKRFIFFATITFSFHVEKILEVHFLFDIKPPDSFYIKSPLFCNPWNLYRFLKPTGNDNADK